MSTELWTTELIEFIPEPAIVLTRDFEVIGANNGAKQILTSNEKLFGEFSQQIRSKVQEITNNQTLIITLSELTHQFRFVAEIKIVEAGIFVRLSDIIPEKKLDAILLTNQTGEIIFCNQQFKSITGYTLHEIKSKDALSFLFQGQIRFNKSESTVTIVCHDGRLKEGQLLNVSNVAQGINQLIIREVLPLQKNKAFGEDIECFLESSNEANLLVDSNLKLIFSNHIARNLFQNYDTQLTPGQSIESLLTFKPETLWHETLHKSLDGKKTEWDTNFESFNQSKHYYSFELNPLRDKTDCVCGILITIRSKIDSHDQQYLRLTQSRLQFLSNNLPDDTVIYQRELNPDGTQASAFFSGGIKKLLGISAEDAENNPGFMNDLIHPNHAAEYAASRIKAIETLTSFDHISRVLLANNEEKWIRHQARPIQLDNGTIAWNGIMTDITYRIKLQLDILNNESNSLAILNTIPNGIVKVNAQGKITFVNPTAQKILDLDDANLLDIYFSVSEKIKSITLDKKDLNDHDLPLARTLSTGEIILDFKQGIITNKGNLKWISVNSLPLYNAQGKVNGAVASFTDLTLQTEKENELKKLAFIASSTDNLVIITDANIKIEWANAAFTKQTGYTLEEAKGKSPGYLLQGPETSLEAKSLMREKIRKREPVACEVLNYTKEGSPYWIHLDIHPIFNDTGELTNFISIEQDITYRKRSEEKFKTAFNSSPDLKLIIRESDNAIIDLNKQIIDITGYTPEEFMASDYYKIIRWPSSDKAKQFFKEYNDNGIASTETEIRHKNGSLKYVQLRSARIYLEGVTHRLLNVRDITDRKLSELSLRESEKLANDLISELSVGVLKQGPRAEILMFNKAALSLLGLTHDQIIGKTSYDPMWKVIHPDGSDFVGHHHPVPKAIRTKEIVSNVVMGVYRPKSEDWIWLLVNAVPYLNDSHEVDYVICSFADITARREAEVKLQRTSQYYESLINAQSNFLVRIGLNGCYSFANQAFYNHFGYKPEDVIGKPANNSIIPEDHQACIDVSAQTINNPGKIFNIRLRKPHPKWGIAWSDWEFMAVVDADNVVTEIQCVGKDITEKILAEEKLELTEANTQSIINNTSMFVWSVDQDFRLITINKTFKEFLAGIHDYDFEHGNVMIPIFTKDFNIDLLISEWTHRYKRAMSGEAFKIEEWINNTFYEFSFSPIIDVNKTLGVTVFGSDQTERINRDQELNSLTKKMAEMKLMAMRSAMNPHFTFNVLNSIQFFIANNDRVNAINYLSIFSSLIRMILTNSVEEKISLHDELEMLSNYIKLEKLRFEDKFDFNFEVEEHISQDEVRIPSLLIQPFVENAILHGLYNKTDQGHLTIRVKELEEAYIHFEIEDDGIGRLASNKLREQQKTKHKSMGTHLTEERLKLINEKDDVSVTYTDLFNGNQPAGTRVNIKIKSS